MFIKYPIFFSDYANCSLPDCFCSVDGTLVPGGLDPKDVPQLIYITFDDAINDENWKLYQVCAKKYKNLHKLCTTKVLGKVQTDCFEKPKFHLKI